MKVLVTGGAGYIGSTVASRLEDSGSTPIVLDDLSTGRREFADGRQLYNGDIATDSLIQQIFDEHPDIEAVVHCAAKIVVPDSVKQPLDYYDANVSKTISFLRSLVKTNCRRIIFSSTAALYATPPDFVVNEESQVDLSSPYAASKAMVERILLDAANAYGLRVLSFRYFNPIGGDPKFRTGLQHRHPTHALGMLMRARETGTPFVVTGNGWPTRDGTGIRDYIHVWDLATAHLRALERFDHVVTVDRPYEVINLGVGAGVTVRELIEAYIEVTGDEVDVADGPARPGDTAGAYTSAEKAHRMLGWRASLTLEQSIADSVEWRRRWTSGAHTAGPSSAHQI